jgi:hypothetical protein
MSIRYDFDPKKHTDVTGITHPVYRNNPNRWLVQAREREMRVHTTYRGVQRRIKRWTPWRTVLRCATSADSFEALEFRKRNHSLAEWRITWGGKVVDRSGKNWGSSGVW